MAGSDPQEPTGPPKSPDSGRSGGVQAPPEEQALLVKCVGCNVDISRVCYGLTMPAPGGFITYPIIPLRCPECNIPLVYSSRVISMRRGGRIS